VDEDDSDEGKGPEELKYSLSGYFSKENFSLLLWLISTSTHSPVIVPNRTILSFG
jgi:hypothetical protein